MKFSRYNRYSSIGSRIIRSFVETSAGIAYALVLRNFRYNIFAVVTVLSVIKKLNRLNSLITGKTSYLNSTSLLI